MKTYLEMISLPTFEERFKYLQCFSKPSQVTFGKNREMNQILYSSSEWKRVRQQVIIRDNGCDLAIEERPISTKILIHHINPITIDQVVNHDPVIFDLNNLVCVSYNTHEAIHYSDERILIPSKPVVRTPGDTKLW